MTTMKKSTKMRLNRETLRQLSRPDLERVGGRIDHSCTPQCFPTTITWPPGLCDPGPETGTLIY